MPTYFFRLHCFIHSYNDFFPFAIFHAETYKTHFCRNISHLQLNSLERHANKQMVVI